MASFLDQFKSVEMSDGLFQDVLNFLQEKLEKFDNKALIAIAVRSDQANLLYIYPCIVKLFQMHLPFVVLDDNTLLETWMRGMVRKCELLIADEHYKKFFDVNKSDVLGVFDASDHLGPLYLAFSGHKEKKLLSKSASKTFSTAVDKMEETAYVVQTSGTTSSRRSVFVSRECFLSNLRDFDKIFELNRNDVILAASPVTFDPFYLDVCLASSKKSHLLMLSPTLKMKPNQLNKRLSEHRISFAQLTPTFYLNLRHNFCLDKLKYLVLGGESFPSTIEKSENCQVYQAYGLTEMSVWQTLVLVNDSTPRDNYNRPAISAPNMNLLSDTDISVEDVTNGMGEIVVRSSSRLCTISPQSEDCLILKSKEGTDLYRVKTRDLARVDEKGNIFFEGRKKGHLKIGGKRTSLTELQQVWNEVTDTKGIVLATSIGDRSIAIVVNESSSTSLVSIWRDKTQNLPVHLRPSEVMEVETLPITNNGKIDLKQLEDLYYKTHEEKKNLESLWKRFTGLDPKSSSEFLFEGGDSLKAVQLAQLIEEKFIVEMNQVLEILLTSCYSNLATLLEKTDVRYSAAKRKSSFSSLSSEKVPKNREESNEKGDLDCHEEVPLVLKFTVDLEKCIDATPLVFRPNSNIDKQFEDGMFIIIGSHSGLVICVDAQAGAEKWRRRLPDRVEASANASKDSSLVFVGCYDGHMYALASTNGSVIWRHKIGSIIKSKPLINDSNLIFGGYDKIVHCLKIVTGETSFKFDMESSIKADVVMFKQNNAGIVADLRGNVVSFDLINGNIKWRTKVKGPVFGTPAITNHLVVVPQVTGHLTALNALSGNNIWTFTTPSQSSIFTSIRAHKSLLIFGLQKGEILALNKEGSVVYSIKHTARIVSTPFVFFDITKDEFQLISVSVDGQVVLGNVDTGVVIRRFSLNKDSRGIEEIFSSPIVINNKLFIGSRDNHLSCYHLNDDKFEN